jgi:Tfp pilus assembly protein PilO
MRKLSKRDKRALIGLGAALALYVLIFHGILPFYDAKAAVQDELTQKERVLRGALKTMQRRDVHSAELAEIDKVLAQYQPRFLDAQDPSTAATQLDDIVRNLASETGVSLTKSNPLQEKKIGERYTKVTIQINLDGDLASTTNFLHKISVHPKFLLVEDFAVSRFRMGQQLQPRMNVSAFIRLS